MDSLQRRARRLFAFRRGILALDTAPAELAVRFRAVALAPTSSAVEGYRAMVLGSPGLAGATSGVVLPADAFSGGVAEELSATGILPGVRADTGHERLTSDARDRVTSGLDGLVTRLERLRGLGATFAVWSAAASVVPGDRGMHVLDVNGHAAARFARLCHDLDVLPIIRVGTRVGTVDNKEAGGAPSAEARSATLAAALMGVCGHLADLNVDRSAVVVGTELDAGAGHDTEPAGPLAFLPAGVGGVLLSARGGPAAATAGVLAAVSATAPPWPVTFYLGRDVTWPALAAWRGRAGSVADGRQAVQDALAAVTAIPAGRGY